MFNRGGDDSFHRFIRRHASGFHLIYLAPISALTDCVRKEVTRNGVGSGEFLIRAKWTAKFQSASHYRSGEFAPRGGSRKEQTSCFGDGSHWRGFRRIALMRSTGAIDELTIIHGESMV